MFQRNVLCWVLAATGLSGASVLSAADSGNRYELPRDKRNVEPCLNLALREHPGTVQQVLERKTDKGYHYDFEIKDAKGSVWVVTCDLGRGRILDDHLLD